MQRRVARRVRFPRLRRVDRRAFDRRLGCAPQLDTTSPHALRHRRAQDLLDEGMPLEWVAALLGHERPDTTRVVYAWETDEDRLSDMVATYGVTPSEAQRRKEMEGDLE